MRKYLIFFCFLIQSLLFSFEFQNTSWRVKNIAVFDDVITGEFDQSIVGSVLKYTDTSIIFDNREYKIKKENIEFWTESDLYNETRGSQSRGLTFQDLNTKLNEICVIDYKIEGLKYPLGAFVIILSENSMLSTYKGNYFFLEKVTEVDE